MRYRINIYLLYENMLSFLPYKSWPNFVDESFLCKGAFNNYVDRIFFHFLTPSPCVDSFLYLERGQKQTFLDPLSPSSSPRSYWMPPKATLKEEKNSFPFWSSGGPKINECEDGKREVSNPWFCMVDNRKKEKNAGYVWLKNDLDSNQLQCPKYIFSGKQNLNKTILHNCTIAKWCPHISETNVQYGSTVFINLLKWFMKCICVILWSDLIFSRFNLIVFMNFSGLVISIKSVSCPNYFWLVENILESTHNYEHLWRPIFSAFGFAVAVTGADRSRKTQIRNGRNSEWQ